VDILLAGIKWHIFHVITMGKYLQTRSPHCLEGVSSYGHHGAFGSAKSKTLYL